MREAVGGSMLLYILIPVLFIFLAFMAFIMKYASVYRASNYLITQIETCEADMSNCDHYEANDIKTKYYYTGKVDYCCNYNDKGSVFRVILYVKFELPLIGGAIKFPVKTETKTLYTVSKCKASGITLSSSSVCNK